MKQIDNNLSNNLFKRKEKELDKLSSLIHIFICESAVLNEFFLKKKNVSITPNTYFV